MKPMTSNLPFRNRDAGWVLYTHTMHKGRFGVLGIL